MNIIVEGDMRRINRPKRFTCPYCGCVFEANQDEYEYRIGWRNDGYFVTYCPTCGKEVTMDEEAS